MFKKLKDRNRSTEMGRMITRFNEQGEGEAIFSMRVVCKDFAHFHRGSAC